MGLPVENGFFQKTNQRLNKELASVNIEGGEEYLVGHIGCSNSAFGRNLMAKINKVILKERANKIKEYYQSWLLANDKASHDELIKKTF